MPVLTDHEMVDLIAGILSRDSRVDFHEIDIRVEGGVVYVSGTVDSAAERHAVLEDIESSHAVKIVDDISLANFIERTDEELTAAVRQALIRDIAVDARPIGVEAKGGKVVLTGRVASHAQKYNAEDAAWWTPGVTEVISHLEVDGIVEPPDEPDY